jgi:hypothetical protein
MLVIRREFAIQWQWLGLPLPAHLFTCALHVCRLCCCQGDCSYV